MQKRVKKLRKSLEIKNKALPLHPQSRDTQYRMIAARFLDKNFLKKSSQKIWWLKINHLSLHPQSRDTQYRMKAARFLEKFFEKSSSKIWRFQKFALPLHHFPTSKNEVRK